MKILSIETSCDETGVAVLEKKDKIKVLTNELASQVELHKQHGGVHPTIAIREHRKKLPILLERALEPSLDYLAVTVGPGLEPCLWAGIEFIKVVAISLDLPVIPVNHIEAHILTPLMNKSIEKFLPAVALIVSGGHTQLVLVKDVGEYKILGRTRDDAAGECFDKTARIIGLPYPGGPAIASEASNGNKLNIELPRPMKNTENYDFSFSGLKTAVLYYHKEQTDKSEEYISSMSFAIQEAINDVLIHKTAKASKDFSVKSVILGGGVSANKDLRKKMKEKLNVPLLTTSPALATDNGVMIGVSAFFNENKAVHWSKLKADANLSIND